MTKKDKIKEIVCSYAKSFGVGSYEWKQVFIRQDAIVNRIDRNWRKEMIDIQHHNLTEGGVDVWYVFHFLNGDLVR